MIVPVKKAELYILKDQYEELLKIIQKNEFLMVDDKNQQTNIDVSDLDDLLVRVKRTIEYLESFREKRKFFEYKEASYDKFDNRTGKYLELLENLERLEKRSNDYLKKLEQLEKKLNFYQPFLNQQLNLEDLSNTKYIDFYHGFVNEKKQEELRNFFETNNIIYEFFSKDKRGTAVSFIVLKDEKTNYLEEAKRIDFEEIEMPIYDGDISEYLDNLEIEKTKNEVFLKEINEEISSYVPKLKHLYIYADQIASDKIRRQVPYVVHSEKMNILKISGWIKKSREAEIRETLTEYNFDYELETFEPSSNEVPPTAIENNKFVEPFEVITAQFSAPNHKELDPNPAMSFWYWLIFGIMMGDVGYGLIMVVGLGLVLKLLKPKGGTRQLLTVLFYSGFTTILFGILHGSFFGFDFDLGKIVGSWFGQNWTTVLLDPIEDALTMLIYSLAIGFIQIIHGLLLKAKLLFQMKKPTEALGGAISYVLILLGLGLVALSMVNLPFTLSIWVGLTVSIIGVALIFIFLGNDKGIMGMITSKLGGLYGVINQLSDILSYSRILALALSTAVIAFTFNVLAGMLQGSIIGFIISLLIYLIGHTFNMAIGLLSTYIHDSRLQYVEFFGQFFEGGGYFFTPLALELNYINEIKNSKDIGGF